MATLCQNSPLPDISRAYQSSQLSQLARGWAFRAKQTSEDGRGFSSVDMVVLHPGSKCSFRLRDPAPGTTVSPSALHSTLSVVLSVLFALRAAHFLPGSAHRASSSRITPCGLKD